MTDNSTVKVWDIAVRVFHWSLVVVFVVAYFSGDDDNPLHVPSGYAVLALVAFRILWGFVGTEHARFTNFVRGPKETLRYAKSVLARHPVHYVGHNPLGGWMIVALLLALAATCWTGLETYGADGHGPLARLDGGPIASAHANGDDDDERSDRAGGDAREEFWEEIHEALSNLTLALAILHVLGVVVSSVLERENLAKAMVTGYKIRRSP